MNSWIEIAKGYIEPISAVSDTGEDPRYSDEFSLLKAEVEKKTDVDFEKIQYLSESILKAKAKDIRVVSYLILSLARLEGMAGLGLGMTVLQELVAAYGDQLLPVKQKVRLSAIRWFQQEKVLTFAKSATKNVTQADVEATLEIYNKLFENLSVLSGEPQSWPDLLKWLNNERQSQAPVHEKTTPNKVDGVESPVVPKQVVQQSAASSNQGTVDINSSGQYIQVVRSLQNYFKEQKQYAKAFGIACSCQWAGIKLPPNENGRTRLPAPRETSLNRIRNAIDNEQWLEGLLASLDAFMEPGGQYLFDIAKSAADCARNSGEKDTAELIQDLLSGLVRRLPKIVQLRFENDDPFASSSVASWLEQINEASSNRASAKGDDYTQILQKAREIASESNLLSALEYLKNEPRKNELQKVQLEFCEAQLCVEQSRSDVALPIFLLLENKVEQLNLASVVPDLAMLIWRQLYRLLKDKLTSIKQDEGREEMENHLNHLKSLMCTTDVASAMQWL